MKYKNLVITQNAKLFQSIRPILICADLDVSQVTTYQKALELLSCFHYVLVVADLSFPDIDGIKLIHSLRRLAQVPILAFELNIQQRRRSRFYLRALTTIWIAVLSWTLSVVWLISQLSHDAIFGKIVQSAQRFLFQETASKLT